MSRLLSHTINSRLGNLAGVLVLGILVLSACAPAATSAPPTPVETTAPEVTEAPVIQPTEVPTTEPSISAASDPKLGDILVGDNGMTLYMFTKDGPNQSNCNADCLAKWPPLLTQGSPILAEGIDPSLVGTATLSDGSLIATYNQMPLYYWVDDKQAGDTTGQGVGGVWFVVSPAGNVVKDASLSFATDPKLGDILVGDNGMTLYMFTKDGPNQSNCNADCLAKWPPLLTLGSPILAEGIDPSLVGTASLPDGSLIATYNKMPLYYWIDDKQAGDTTGQGVGGVWFVVSPAGNVVKDASLSFATDPKLGDILVGDNGMTLYMFTKDGPNQSNCNADCLAKWPPLLTQGSPILAEGIDASLVGTAALPDGSLIVTYNKMPLYYWIDDKQAGDTTGQGVGGVWFVVSPAGNVVKDASLSFATDPKLGDILVGDNGMTLYMFTKDGPNQSNCNADCLAKWPPLLTQGSPILAEGIDASLVGTAALPDGSLIVTYNKMPLYYWVDDKQPGDTTGQGVGGVWFVVSPDGNAAIIQPPAPAPTPKPTKKSGGTYNY